MGDDGRMMQNYAKISAVKVNNDEVTVCYETIHTYIVL